MNPTDDDLVLYAEGVLSQERRQQLIDASKNNPDLAETLAALDASRLPFKQAFDQQAVPAVPDALKNSVRDLIKEKAENNLISVRDKSTFSQWPLRFAQAACLALCIGAGYVTGITQGDNLSLVAGGDTDTAGQGANADLQVAWVQRVVDYQSLYVANTVGNVEVDLNASLRQLEKLSESSGMRTAIPDLSEAGYTFTRAQELGFDGTPLVQLVYTKEGHTPLALCFMPADGDSDQAANIAQQRGLGAVDWIVDDQRFVIVADESVEAMERLYKATQGVFSDV